MPGAMYMSGVCLPRKKFLELPDNQRLPEGSPSLSGLSIILSALIGIHRKVRERGHHRPSHSVCTSLPNPADLFPTPWIWLWLSNTTGLYILGVWLHHALFFCGCDLSGLVSFKNSYNFYPLVGPFLVFPDYYQLLDISIYIGTDIYVHFFCPLMESGVVDMPAVVIM